MEKNIGGKGNKKFFYLRCLNLRYIFLYPVLAGIEKKKQPVNVYSPVFTCLRPYLVKGKLFMLPLNSLLKRSRAGNSHNNPHNGSVRPAKRCLGHVRRETSAPLSSWKKISSLVILHKELWRAHFTRKSDLSQRVEVARSEQYRESREVLPAVLGPALCSQWVFSWQLSAPWLGPSMLLLNTWCTPICLLPVRGLSPWDQCGVFHAGDATEYTYIHSTHGPQAAQCLFPLRKFWPA